MPTLYIIRGLPGSGKSSFADSLQSIGAIKHYWEADEFMRDVNGNYMFQPAKLSYCHERCRTEVEIDMQQGYNVAVSNTSTTEREIQPYLDLAEQYGYDVVSLIVENRHGNKSVHGVPDDKMQQMRQRFSVKL